MNVDKKNPSEQPFFAQFLEDQDLTQAQGGVEGGTKKYPSDRDDVTLKYPSDDDEYPIDL